MENGSLEHAIQTAVTAHQGVVDKAKQPYILHPLRVMTRVQRIVGIKPDYLSAAVLHDVVEDTDITFADLAKMGFAPQVIAGIDSVTKRPKENYVTFVRRSKLDPIGCVVKICDIQDNRSRMPLKFDSRWWQKLEIKYSVGLAILNDAHEWLEINRELVAALESA